VEWNQPLLANQFPLLHCIATLTNKSLDRARAAKAINDSLDGHVTIHTDSESILTAVAELTGSQIGSDMEFSLSDCLVVSKATIKGGLVEKLPQDQDTRFLEEDTFSEGEGRRVRVQVSVSAVQGLGKCPRCWKWVCEEGEEMCGRCRHVEQSGEQKVADIL
jgi:isoleucyl-tRNA synthetase